MRAPRYLTDYYRKHFIPDKNRGFIAVKFDGPHSALTVETNRGDYHDHDISMYDTTRKISNDMIMCNTDINANFKVEISKAKTHDDSLTKVVKKLIQQLEHDDALKELGVFFKNDLKTQIAERTVD